jgi:hypothetical protein
MYILAYFTNPGVDMSEAEKKDGIVVHPHFDKEGGEAPHTNMEGTQDLSLPNEALKDAIAKGFNPETGLWPGEIANPHGTTKEQVSLGNAVSGASTATDASDTSAQGSDGQGVLGGGVIVPNVNIQPAPIPAPAPAPVAQAPAQNFIQTGISEVDQIVESLMKNCSMEARLLIDAVKDYIVKMKPGRLLTVKEGTGHQVAFYNTLRSIINDVEADFKPTMQSLLALLHHHRDGAFRETHVFRFVEHVPLSTEHRTGHRKIVTLLKTLANPATRQTLLRQMNFDPLLRHGLTERGRQKLSAFFGK